MAPIIALAGFMGSGKSTVGRLAADQLGWEFVDLDAEVAASAEQSIPALFAEEGEPAFRRRECAALQAVLEREARNGGVILALGGGTVTDSEARALLRRGAVVVYLQTDAAWAWNRVAHSPHRPLAQDRQAFTDLLDRRRALYEGGADHIIDVRGRESAAVATEVADFARSLEHDRP